MENKNKCQIISTPAKKTLFVLKASVAPPKLLLQTDDFTINQKQTVLGCYLLKTNQGVSVEEPQYLQAALKCAWLPLPGCPPTPPLFSFLPSHPQGINKASS